MVLPNRNDGAPNTMKRRSCPRPKGRPSSIPESIQRANRLQGAFTPPYCPALPAQRLGSISLCGGAKSNCAQPQNMSRGKNMRSPGPASCQLPCEEVVCEPFFGEAFLGGSFSCASE